MTNTDLSQQENVWQTLVFTFNHLIKKYATKKNAHRHQKESKT